MSCLLRSVYIVTFHMSARHSHAHVWQFVVVTFLFGSLFRCRLFPLIGLVSVLLLFSSADSPLHSIRSRRSYVPTNKHEKWQKCIENEVEAKPSTHNGEKSIPTFSLRRGELACVSRSFVRC